MFEIYSLAHYFNAYNKSSQVGFSIKLDNKNIYRDNDINVIASSIAPHLKGYSIGVNWVLSKINGNDIKSSDDEILRILKDALLLDLKKKKDLEKIQL
ncbi:MAG: hypothetical protein COB38_08350 [Gammaproteobacteria bacterium]|nr:MAG: hypothetical protein COB38_08350 [Gammaproteobacteria bacterium]